MPARVLGLEWLKKSGSLCFPGQYLCLAHRIQTSEQEKENPITEMFLGPTFKRAEIHWSVNHYRSRDC